MSKFIDSEKYESKNIVFQNIAAEILSSMLNIIQVQIITNRK